MRAEPCALSVRIGNCQPCQERALTPMPSSTMASSPAVTCSPVATTASYSRASCSSGGVAAPGDQLVGDAGHGRDHDGDVIAGVDLALDVARHVADAVEIGDRRPAEFHHQASHDVMDLTFPDAPKGANKRPGAGRKRRVYIPAGSARLQLQRRSASERDGPNGERAKPAIAASMTAEVERFSRHRRRLVGSARADGGAAQVQPGAARPISATRRRRGSAATPRSSTA